MIKAKTGITLLKRLGIILIALPEPVTTPFGVALVLTSGYLSRLREASLNKHLRETLTRYLSHTKHSKDETDNKSHARHKVKGYTRVEDPTILWQDKHAHQVETSHPVLVLTSRDKEDNTVRHSVDMESLARHYPVTDASQVKTVSPHAEVTPVETEKLIHHSVDTQFLSRRYPVTSVSNAKAESSHSEVAPVEPEKLIHHNIDMQMLGRRYKAFETSKVASPADKSDPAENVVHHPIRVVSLSRRHPETVSSRTDTNKTTTPETDETVEHHSIDLKFLSRRYQMV